MPYLLPDYSILITDWDFASVARSELKAFYKEKSIPDINGLKVCDGSGKSNSAPVYVDATGWIQCVSASISLLLSYRFSTAC